MKKLSILIIAAIIPFVLSSCLQNENDKEPKNNVLINNKNPIISAEKEYDTSYIEQANGDLEMVVREVK